MLDGRRTGDRTGGYADEAEVEAFSALAMNGSIATLRNAPLLGSSSAANVDTSSTKSCRNSGVCGSVEKAWNTPLAAGLRAFLYLSHSSHHAPRYRLGDVSDGPAGRLDRSDLRRKRCPNALGVKSRRL